MKRTGEIILVVIGMILAGFTTFLGYSFKSLTTNQVFLDEVSNGLYELGYSEQEIQETISLVVDLGQPLMIASILAIIVGIVSIFLLVGNKNAKVAGIILLIIAVVGGVYSQLAIGFTSILFIIAGIMALVRKPKELIDDEYYVDL